jgi:hypothetical protein
MHKKNLQQEKEQSQEAEVPTITELNLETPLPSEEIHENILSNYNIESIRNSDIQNFLQAQLESPTLKSLIAKVNIPINNPSDPKIVKHRSGIYFRISYNKQNTKIGEKFRCKQLLVPEQFRREIFIYHMIVHYPPTWE